MHTLERRLTEIYMDVYYFVNSRINDDDSAKDITQSVMETAIHKYSSLKKKESFKAWVMQIANSKINAYYNELKKINSILTYRNSSTDNVTDFIVNDIEDAKADILNLLVNRENQINLTIALSRLETKYSEVIRMKFICGYNFMEISEILNVNINTVRTWSARGLIKLREEFIRIDSGGGYENIEL